MLQRLYLKLDLDKDFVSKTMLGEAFHGVLMERLDTNAAYQLHQQKTNPYSQFLHIQREDVIWTIQTLTKEAGQQIIMPLTTDKFMNFHLRRISRDIKIINKDHSLVPMKDLVNQFYFGKGERILRIRFLTPTSFKRCGEYIFYPDLRLLFGSLMRKHSYICEGSGEEDTETLDSLVKNTDIVRYDLKSVYSEIGSVRLPAFCGMVVLKFSGPQSLINYAHFLLRFGEYSGVGIKCALGMGAMRVIDKPDNRINRGDVLCNKQQ